MLFHGTSLGEGGMLPCLWDPLSTSIDMLKEMYVRDTTMKLPDTLLVLCQLLLNQVMQSDAMIIYESIMRIRKEVLDIMSHIARCKLLPEGSTEVHQDQFYQTLREVGQIESNEDYMHVIFHLKGLDLLVDFYESSQKGNNSVSVQIHNGDLLMAVSSCIQLVRSIVSLVGAKNRKLGVQPSSVTQPVSSDQSTRSSMESKLSKFKISKKEIASFAQRTRKKILAEKDAEKAILEATGSGEKMMDPLEQTFLQERQVRINTHSGEWRTQPQLYTMFRDQKPGPINARRRPLSGYESACARLSGSGWSCCDKTIYDSICDKPISRKPENLEQRRVRLEKELSRELGEAPLSPNQSLKS